MNSLSPYDPRPDEIATQRSPGQMRLGSSYSGSAYSKEAENGNVKRAFRRWPIALVLAVIFGTIGLVYCLFAKKMYESTAEVLLQSPSSEPSFALPSQMSSIAGLVGLSNLSGDTPTQIEVMTSDEAIREVAQRTGINPDPAKSRPLITISPHKASSSIVMISYKDPSPTRAQAAVEALVKVYNEHMGHEDSTVTGRMILTTQAQIASVSAKLAHSEQALANYSRQVGSIDPVTESVQKVQQLYTIRKEELDAKRDLIGQQTQYQDYKNEISALDPSEVPSLTLSPSPLIQADESKLSDLQEARSKLAAQYTPQDDEMVQNQQQIDAVRKDITSEMQREAKATDATLGTMDKSHKTKPTSGSASGYIVNSLTHAVNPVREAAKQQMIDAQAMMLADNAQLSVLDRAVANSDSDMAATPDKYMRLGDLKNDSTVYQKLYDDLQAQLVQLNARRPADQSYATMLQLPTVPKVPASPRIVLYTTVATVLGALLGVVLIFMLDTFDPTVRDPADIALLADIPVLQSLPYHPENGHSPKNEQISQQSYQRLASTLSYSGLGTRLKTLMLTSANSSEGSSEVAAKLAAALAKAGRRIILVDATGVEPRIVPIGNQKNDEYISDSAGPGSSDSSLPVKSSETPALNVSALLESSDTEALVRQLKLDADVVIFDAPAIFEGVNTAVLAEQVDAVLFISKLEGMTRDEIRQALGLILSGPAPVLGVVLNDKRL